jgi:hypothetical protein
LFDYFRLTRETRDSCVGLFPACNKLSRAVVVVLLGASAVGCVDSAFEADADTSEGEAVMAALKHVAAIKWGLPEPTPAMTRVAVEYRGETPLPEPTRRFLDGAFEARGWRWSTEDPLVDSGNCYFPLGDCRLKDPTELHLAFSVEPTSDERGYRLGVTWLSSRHWNGDGNAGLGGYGIVVTQGTDGLVAEVYGEWIT